MRVSENDKGSLSLTVRALAQLTGTAPDVIFRDAIGQAHRFALLPNEEPCIYGLLEQYHFIRQNTALEQKILGELTAYMEENCMPGTVALVQFRFCGRAFFPVSADVDGNYRMGVVQIMGDRELRSVWLRWPDLEDHSLSRRRHRNSRGGTRNASGLRGNMRIRPFSTIFSQIPEKTALATVFSGQ